MTTSTLLLSTTGTLANVQIDSLGKAVFTHPVVNLDLFEEFEKDVIVRDEEVIAELNLAIANGFITISDTSDGSNVTDVSAANLVAYNQLNGGPTSTAAQIDAAVAASHDAATALDDSIIVGGTGQQIQVQLDTTTGGGNNTLVLTAGEGLYVPPAASALEVLDEGVSLTSATTSIDFTGVGVTASNVGNDVTVNIPGTVGYLNINGDTGTAAASIVGDTLSFLGSTGIVTTAANGAPDSVTIAFDIGNIPTETTIAGTDLIIFGDASDSNNPKVITADNLGIGKYTYQWTAVIDANVNSNRRAMDKIRGLPTNLHPFICHTAATITRVTAQNQDGINTEDWDLEIEVNGVVAYTLNVGNTVSFVNDSPTINLNVGDKVAAYFSQNGTGAVRAPGCTMYLIDQ